MHGNNVSHTGKTKEALEMAAKSGHLDEQLQLTLSLGASYKTLAITLSTGVLYLHICVCVCVRIRICVHKMYECTRMYMYMCT